MPGSAMFLSSASGIVGVSFPGMGPEHLLNRSALKQVALGLLYFATLCWASLYLRTEGYAYFYFLFFFFSKSVEKYYLRLLPIF